MIAVAGAPVNNAFPSNPGRDCITLQRAGNVPIQSLVSCLT